MYNKIITIKKSLDKIFNLKQKKTVVLFSFLLFLLAILEMIAVGAMSPFMTVLLDSSTITTDATLNIISKVFKIYDTQKLILFFSLFLFSLYLIKGIYMLICNNSIAKFIGKSQSELSSVVFSALINKNYSYLTKKNSADISKMLTHDILNVFYFLHSFMFFICEIFTSFCIVLLLLVLNWQLTSSILLIVSILSLIIISILLKPIKESGKSVNSSIATMIKYVNETFNASKYLKVCNKHEYFINKYKSAGNLFANSVSKNNFLASIPKVVLESISISIVFLIFAMMFTQEINTITLLPLLSSFALAAFKLLPAVNRSISSLNQMIYFSSSIINVHNLLLDLEKDEHGKHLLQNSSDVNDSIFASDIDIINISFKFTDADEYLYENFSLKIPFLKSTAFIGRTGSGKTTLADIILGLYPPDSGHIMVNHTDIYQHLKSWSKVIGYIPQTIPLSDESIRFNVAFGYEDSEIDNNWLLECLEKAQIKDFVLSLPMGINTIIGEQGVRLSGGQRQRIGIARALYSKPQFLVLDEATASLDNETECAIMDAIKLLSGKITLLIIAHRLATIENCDIIYKIEDGKVVETRTKNES